jgi:hypothetical protein
MAPNPFSVGKPDYIISIKIVLPKPPGYKGNTLANCGVIPTAAFINR